MIYSKLEVRLGELFKNIQDALSNLEVVVSKNLNQPQVSRQETKQKIKQQEEVILDQERAIFESREEALQIRQELDQAKMCIVQ